MECQPHFQLISSGIDHEKKNYIRIIIFGFSTAVLTFPEHAQTFARHSDSAGKKKSER